MKKELEFRNLENLMFHIEGLLRVSVNTIENEAYVSQEIEDVAYILKTAIELLPIEEISAIEYQKWKDKE